MNAFNKYSDKILVKYTNISTERKSIKLHLSTRSLRNFKANSKNIRDNVVYTKASLKIFINKYIFNQYINTVSLLRKNFR